MLSKITTEVSLNTELDDHLGYDKNEISDSSNSRHDYSSKTIQTEVVNSKLTRPVIITEVLYGSINNNVHETISITCRV